MKAFFSVLILFSQWSQAVEFVCYDMAVSAAAKELEYTTTEEFLDNNSEIWSCKDKKNPNLEEIQFGDGRGLVGVSLEIVNGQCTVKEVYTGQDDQDGDPELDKELCLQ